MNIFKRIWRKFRDYQDNPTLNDEPFAPDAEAVSPLYDQTLIEEKFTKNSAKEKR